MNPQLNPAPINPFADLQVKTSGTEPLPPNAYYAAFTGVEPFSNEKVSGKLRFSWEVVSGTHKGRIATALADANLTAQTHAGRLIAGILGRPLVPGESVGELWEAIQRAIGTKFMVTVSPGPKGGKPSVQSVSLPPE